MSSPNTTSSSMVNDLLASMVIGGGAELPTNSGHSPTASAKPTETIVSIHSTDTSPTADGPAESADSMVHDDADVQEYMNRLLKRSSSSQSTTTIQSEPTPAAPQPVVPKEEVVQKVWEQTEFIPKSVAPEKKANLTALREVANQSQRSAIETSSRQRLQAKSLKYLALTFASLAFGTLFMYMSTKMFDASMITGVACFVVSIPTLGQLLRSLRPESSKRRKTK